MTAPRKLIVNADDFGFTGDVNEGILEAHRRGILSSTSLMATGAAFEDAVRLARENPSLEVGCHLVLVGGHSLLQPGRALPARIRGLAAALALRRIRVYEELAAQVRKVLEAGLQPTHLDTHKHTHLWPPVLEAVARISEEFRVPWVRLPLLGRKRARAFLQRHGCRTTDHFAGYRLTGRWSSEELMRFIRELPAGATELMCHPGRCGAELRSARTRLKESRERELEALTAPETRAALEAAQVQLVRRRDL